MKSDLVLAIGALAAEKNLPRDTVFNAVEEALASAYRREGDHGHSVKVRIDPETGDITAFYGRRVVEEQDEDEENPEDTILLEEARRYKPDAQIGEVLEFDVSLPETAGRIAAQTAKQVVLQRLREAERDSVFDEFADREGEIVLATVQRADGRQVILELGRGTEAIMPGSHSVRSEHLRPGQRVRVLIHEVQKATRGPQVIVSRSSPEFVRKLFETEVPEIKDGRVEIVSIAREAGYRTKIAVYSHSPNIDPIGAAVGMRATRIQNIVNELNGERIDVVLWDPDPERFVANSLSPAEVVKVDLDGEEQRATVYVPDRMLSLAIGREGQNARLAARLTGWWITIHSEAALERVGETVTEAPSEFAPAPPGEEPVQIVSPLRTREERIEAEEAAAIAAEEQAEAAVTVEETEAPPVSELAEPVTEALPPVEEIYEEPEPEEAEEDFEEPAYDQYELEEFEDEDGESGIRFAEDVLPARDDDDRPRKKKKKQRRAPRFVDRVEEDLEEIDYTGRIH